MKKCFLIPLMICIGLLVCCSDPNSDSLDDGSDNPDNSGQKTLVVFDNTQGICTAVVYNDSRRREEDKIAEVPAGQCSSELECLPGDSVPFYFSYRVSLKNVEGFAITFVPEVGKDQKAVRVDANTKNNIIVPRLDETLSSPGQFLSSNSHLLIQNNSSFSFELHQGTSPVKPDNSPSAPLVNSGEKAWYTIIPGLSGNYRLLVGAEYIAFPASPNSFAAGRFYSFAYNNGAVSLGSELEIKLDNITAPSQNTLVPASVTANALSSNSIQVTWNAVSGATAYKVYRSGAVSDVYRLIGTTTDIFWNDSGLSPETVYYYKISTVHSGGESALSSLANATTSSLASISAPAGVSASALNGNSIYISWYSVSGAAGYRVYRAVNSNGSYTLLGDSISASYTDSGLSAGTTFYYKVAAYTSTEESGLSSYAAATTQTNTGGTIDYPPTQPTGLVVSSAYSGSITLTWNSADRAVSYNVYRSNTKDGAAVTIPNIIGTTYTDTVEAGVPYYYKVAGVNTSGIGVQSAGAFGWATVHDNLGNLGNAQLLYLGPRSSHFYRFEVTKGTSYVITWQNGSNQNSHTDLRVYAYQNDGTTIFSDAYNGYTSAKGFTASMTGYVTVEVFNINYNTSFNYKIYY